MSVDRDFTIKVSTIADTAGAQEANASLKKVGQTSEETGVIGEKSAKGMFESHHELHNLLHAIGNDAVPGMGRAFAALAMGPLGAVVAMATAIEFVKSKIDSTSQALETMAENSGKAFGGGDWLTDYVNAAQQAQIASENLAEAMHKAADAGDPVKNRYDAEAKAIQATANAIKEKLKAQEESDLADAQKSGASPEVIAAQEAAIRARYESQSGAAQDAADQMLQQARQRELSQRQQNQPALDTAAQSALTPARVAQARTARESELNAQETALAKATADLNTAANDELNKRIENLKFGLGNMRRDHVRGDIIKARESQIAELESQTAESREADTKDRIGQLSKEVLKDQQNAAKEKIARDDATNAATENTKRIVELQKQIAEANTAAQIKTESLSQLINGLASAADTKTFEKAAGVDTNAGAADFIRKFLASQGHLTQHQGTKEDQQMVALLNMVLQKTQQSDNRTFQLLQELILHKGNLDAAVADLQRKNQQMMRVVESKGR